MYGNGELDAQLVGGSIYFRWNRTEDMCKGCDNCRDHFEQVDQEKYTRRDFHWAINKARHCITDDDEERVARDIFVPNPVFACKSVELPGDMYSLNNNDEPEDWSEQETDLDLLKELRMRHNFAKMVGPPASKYLRH